MWHKYDTWAKNVELWLQNATTMWQKYDKCGNMFTKGTTMWQNNDKDGNMFTNGTKMDKNMTNLAICLQMGQQWTKIWQMWQYVYQWDNNGQKYDKCGNMFTNGTTIAMGQKYDNMTNVAICLPMGQQWEKIWQMKMRQYVYQWDNNGTKYDKCGNLLTNVTQIWHTG